MKQFSPLQPRRGKSLDLTLDRWQASSFNNLLFHPFVLLVRTWRQALWALSSGCIFYLREACDMEWRHKAIFISSFSSWTFVGLMDTYDVGLQTSSVVVLCHIRSQSCFGGLLIIFTLIIIMLWSSSPWPVVGWMNTFDVGRKQLTDKPIIPVVDTR